MARLDAATRAKLPDSAFAYVDSRGQRRLPIYDAPHVRNALARFNQVAFEDDAARDRARKRLLSAAKKYRIVPLGFIDGQLRSERELGALDSGLPPVLPTGFLTMVMTDIEGSTLLVRRLGDRYGELIGGVREVLRGCVLEAEGYVVDARADEFFAVFERPIDALGTAISIQQRLRDRMWPDGHEARVRIGIHSGYPTLTDQNYIGMAVHLTARICSAAHGGQIIASGDTQVAAKGSAGAAFRMRSLGLHSLRGIPEPVPLFQVTATGLARQFPPLRTATRELPSP